MAFVAGQSFGQEVITTDNTNTNNTTVNSTTDNTNTNINTTTSTNTNNNTNVNTSTIDATNTNINTNTSTVNSTNVNTNNNILSGGTNNTNTNVNTNNNTSVSTITSDNTNTNNNIISGGTNNTNTNNNTNNTTVNETSNATINSTSNNTNTNNNNNTSNITSNNTNTNNNTNNTTVDSTSNNTNTNTNTNNNNNTSKIEQEIKSPPPSAIAPSISANNIDMCSVGRSGAVQTQILGIAAGGTVRDMNCERLKLSKTLYDMGMKVAAVSVMCQDERVFSAMEMAGTPCPFMGDIGEEASAAWSLMPELRPDADEYKLRQEYIEEVKDAIAEGRDPSEVKKRENIDVNESFFMGLGAGALLLLLL